MQYFSGFYTVMVSTFKVYEGYVDVNGSIFVGMAYQYMRWAKVLRSPPSSCLEVYPAVTWSYWAVGL